MICFRNGSRQLGEKQTTKWRKWCRDQIQIKSKSLINNDQRQLTGEKEFLDDYSYAEIRQENNQTKRKFEFQFLSLLKTNWTKLFIFILNI
jgi:hypothetical protein